MRSTALYRIILFLLCSAGLGIQAFAQVPFAVENTPSIPATATVEWGDYDNDGDADVLYVYNGEMFLLKNNLTGTTSTFASSGISFPAIVDPFGFTVYSYTDHGWFDINRDNRLDIYTLTAANGVKFFIANTTGSFDVVSPTFNSSITSLSDWGDVDGDGQIDLLTGRNIYPFDGEIFKNNGNYDFRQVTQLALTGGFLYDYDIDGDLDIVSQDKVYSNLGDFVFNLFKYFNIDVISNVSGTIDQQLIDVTGDGLPEFIGVSQLGNQFGCQNDQLRVQSDTNPNVITPLGLSPCGLFDMVGATDLNNDGSVDLVLQQNKYGTSSGFGNGLIYVKDTKENGATFTNLVFDNVGEYRLVDYNNDGKMDVSIGGKLLRNILSKASAKPTPPASITASVSGATVSLSWPKGNDAETPANSLTYNLVVTRGGETWFNDLANNGQLLVDNARGGNCGFATFHQLKELPNGVYQAKVQTVDQSLQTSVFTSEVTFEITNGANTGTSAELNSDYVTVFSPDANQYLLCYTESGNLYGELLNGQYMQRTGSRFLIADDVEDVKKMIVGYNPITKKYSVVWHSGKKLQGRVISTSGNPTADATVALYTAANTPQYFHLAGQELLYREDIQKFSVMWMERNGATVVLRLIQLDGALAGTAPVEVRSFTILDGVVFYAYTPATISLTFDSDLEYLPALDKYILFWNMDGVDNPPCPQGCVPSRVKDGLHLESISGSGTWLKREDLGETPKTGWSPRLAFNPINNNVLATWTQLITEFLNLAKNSVIITEVKGKLVSVSQDGTFTMKSNLLDISKTTPAGLANNGNSKASIEWLAERNEFVVSWNKTVFSGGVTLPAKDDILFYRRVNPWWGKLIEDEQQVLSVEKGFDTRLDLNTKSGDLLLAYRTGKAGRFAKFTIPKDPIPVVSQISKTAAYAGEKLIITGLNFGKTPLLNKVHFGEIESTVDNVFNDSTRLQVTVPPGLERTKVPVSVTFDNQTGTSSFLFENLTLHSIASVNLAEGERGTVVTITGERFATDPSLLTVSFSGTAALVADFVSNTATEIKVKVPVAAARGTAPLTVSIQGQVVTAPNAFRVIVPPTIAGIDAPDDFITCKNITIKGSNFSPDASKLQIKFGDVAVPADHIVLSTESTIIVKVPVGARGSVPISVTTDSRTATSEAKVIKPGGTISSFKIPSSFKFTNRTDDKIDLQLKVLNQCSIEEIRFWTRGTSQGNSSYTSTVLTGMEDNRIDFSIAEADFTKDPIGLSAFFEVKDKGKFSFRSDTVKIFRDVAEADTTNIVPNLVFGGDAGNYNVISFPYNLNPNNVGSVFGDLFNKYGYDSSKWRLYHYKNDGSGKKGYVEYLKGLNDVEMGKSYWIIVRYEQKITFGKGTTADVSSGPFKITLYPGWNQVGNPYNFNVNWTEVLTYNKNPADIEAMKVYANGSLSVSTTLKAFSGGFVKYNGTTPLVISIPFSGNGSPGRVKAGEFDNDIGSDTWFMPLNIRNEYTSNTTAGIGMHPKATESGDAYDEHVMPRFPNQLDIRFGSDLSRSFVNSRGEYKWSFEIENATNSGAISLSWLNAEPGNSDRQLFLYDHSLEKAVDMRSTNSYSFLWRRGDRFSIFYGEKGFIDSELKPGKVVLSDPTPNPFSHEATVSFSVVRDRTAVKVDVLNSLGQQVSLLVNDELDAGSYTTAIESQTSGRLAPGVYFVRLQVLGNDPTTIVKRLVRK
ncbi:MAG TPA: IPT/TIG domain-containing protein [Cyclobacteriaceae bacterium]|nr:IPT/TIG domain-containing protein [Cyclobacteriaceae bacterium]